MYNVNISIKRPGKLPITTRGAGDSLDDFLGVDFYHGEYSLIKDGHDTAMQKVREWQDRLLGFYKGAIEDIQKLESNPNFTSEFSSLNPTVIPEIIDGLTELVQQIEFEFPHVVG